MAIQKRFIHFKKFSDFNSKKLSANEANTQYTVGISGATQDGEPDVLYQSYCWIKDTKQQWTHGQLYDGTNSSVTESTVSGWGFTKNTGTYSKPSGGIPKSDLTSAVQTSLGKADTALQSYTEQYKGTVTGVKINGTTKNPSSGVVDLGTVITAHQDISGKQDKLKVVEISSLTITDLKDEVVINLTDEQNSLLAYSDTIILMAFRFPNSTYHSRCVLYYSLTTIGKSYTGITSRAFSYDKKGDNIFVKAVRDNTAKTLTISFSDIIVTKDSLKTINGESILGDGDITISGGGESSQPMVSTTWAELKEMRDSASLVAGTWYRITDYVTTTSQSGTRSLEHPFDVVVLATGADTLSEEARAARHEGDISISVSLMGMNFFYKGVLTVDGVEWFEFENPEAGSIVSSSATPAIGDIVYPYFDGMIATEEAYPIESVSESENEYFLNNNANLDAWKIWYCLDNDKVRFPWAVAKTKKSIVVQTDEATSLTAEYNGTYEYEGIMYYRWDAIYTNIVMSFLTLSDDPQVGDAIPFFGVIDSNMIMEFGGLVYAVNEPSENEGLGVIYRMIDERGNDCPYDFKNIQFLAPITGGQFDENGTEEWVFTFNLNLGDGSASTDYSNTSSCFNNIIKSALLGLNCNIFLNNDVMSQCYNNTLGNECMYNLFNDDCYNNTLGNECMYNLFERYTYRCNVSPNVQSETIANNFGYTTEARVAYDSSNTLKIYCEADVTGDYNDLSNTPTIDTSMSSSSTNAVQNKVIKSYVDSNCNIPVITTTASSQALVANTYYKWSNIPTSITITLTTPTNTNILNNYMFEFTANSSGCTLSVPSSIKWLNEIPPVIEPGKTYQISIINNLATVAKFG